MKLNLITLATVKEELGLTVPDSDVAITAMIPKVSADVRRILNCPYSDDWGADYSTGSAKLTSVVGLDLGGVVVDSGIPDDTYLIEFDGDTGIYTMSAVATADGDTVNPTVNIAMWSAISKMIWYRIGKLTTKGVDDKATTSESYGPVSKTYTDAEINSKWSYPQEMIDDLGTPYSEIG